MFFHPSCSFGVLYASHILNRNIQHVQLSGFLTLNKFSIISSITSWGEFFPLLGRKKEDLKVTGLQDLESSQ